MSMPASAPSTHPKLQRVTREGIAAETSSPAEEKLIYGRPIHRNWPIEAADGLYAGLWQSTPGHWRVSYDEWEYVHILGGHSVLHEAGGTAIHLRAGDSFILRPGFKGSWEVIETTLKEYVIRE